MNLDSISEQIPTLLAPIAEELDVNVGALKKFAAEGKLTSEVVLRALRQIEKDGGACIKRIDLKMILHRYSKI